MSKTEYKNIIVTGATTTKNGEHLTTRNFDEVVAGHFESIAAEIRREVAAGRSPGKFLIRKRSPNSLATGRSKATHFIEYVPAAEVQAYEAANPPRRPDTQGL